VPISGIVTVGVFGDFTEDFIVTCGAYSNSADIAVVINIGLTKEYIEAKNTIEANNTRQLLNEQINTYRDKSHYNKVHSPYLHRSKERSYDFNASDASSNSPLITVVTNQSNIDNYGNVGTIRISTTGNNKIFSKVTKNTYSNDTTNWHLGRLSKAKVTHNAANTPSITRTSSFTYNSDGLLKSETIGECY
jgi:hypothetical protein